jgi:hypothetical protein
LLAYGEPPHKTLNIEKLAIYVQRQGVLIGPTTIISSKRLPQAPFLTVGILSGDMPSM